MKAAKKLLIPLLSLALFLGLFNTVFFWGYIPSSSMEPTIHFENSITEILSSLNATAAILLNASPQAAEIRLP